MTIKIEVNELPTGVITAEIPFQIRDKKTGDSRYDWKASLPFPSPDDDGTTLMSEESERYFKTPKEALDDLFKTFGVEREA